MDLILFLFFAVIVVITSYKLSYYADCLDKETKLGSFIIGAIMLATVTSLPEIFTSIFSLTLDNPSLILGSILGGSIFNILIIVIFDILYMKKMFMNRISKYFVSIHLVLIYIYLSIISYFEGDLTGGIHNIGIPTIVILLGLLVYIMILLKVDTDDRKIFNVRETYLKLKIILSILIIAIGSGYLVYFTNHIAKFHSLFSTSLTGALLIGITISLSEIMSTYNLLKLESYNLAYANIIGSNMINLIVLAICDLILSNKIIYDFYDSASLSMVSLCLWFNIVLLYSTIRKKSLCTLTYIIPSLIMLIMFIIFVCTKFIY